MNDNLKIPVHSVLILSIPLFIAAVAAMGGFAAPKLVTAPELHPAITLDLEKAQIVFQVYEPGKKKPVKYVIDLDKHAMSRDGKDAIEFAPEEAEEVGHMLGTIGRYCGSSYNWFRDPKAREQYWERLEQFRGGTKTPARRGD